MFRKSADFKVIISGIRNAVSFEWEDMSDEEIKDLLASVISEEIQYVAPLDISEMEIRVETLKDGYRYTEAFDHDTMSHLQAEKLLELSARAIQRYKKIDRKTRFYGHEDFSAEELNV